LRKRETWRKRET
jgi:hypothetical protein